MTISVAIIGAGFAGIGAAIRLKDQGITDFVIYERDSRVGGTWRDNTYPGAACDIPSRLYSYSFAPNPDWSHTYSGSAEILQYIDGMVATAGLESQIRFGHNVTGVVYDQDAGEWTVRFRGRKPVRARAVIVASGPLANVSLPDIRASTPMRVRRSTAPVGITISISRARRSPSSAPAPAGCRSSRNW